MTKITVLSKQTQTILIEDQSKQIFLNQPSIVQLNIGKDDILSTSRNGNDAVILLKNGEQIVLTNFFLVKDNLENTLVIPQKDGNFTFVNINEEGIVTDYRGNIDLGTLLSVDNKTLSLNLNTQQTEEGFSLADFLETNGSKIGLAVALGFGIVPLLDDGKDSKKSAPAIDVEKPDAPKAELSTDGTKITGQAEANAKVILLDASRNIVTSVNADKNGQYNIDIPKGLQTGGVLSLVAQDAASNLSTETRITTKDNLAPDRPVAQMNDEGNNISGKAEANSTIEVYDEAGKLVASIKANVNGEFSVNIQPAVQAGKALKVLAKDAAGNPSESVQVEAGKDTIPPETPKKLDVSADGTVLTGLTEPKAHLVIKNEKDEIIGSGEANDKGEFSIKMSPALTGDLTAKLYVKDVAGNESVAIGINAKTDTAPPDAPTAILNESGLEVTGKAEAGSTVYVKSLDDKTILGSTKVGEDGSYKITLSKALTDKTKVNVTAVDPSNNSSEAFILEGIDKDTVAPAAPSVTELIDDIGEFKGSIKNNGITDDNRPLISGRGEAGATVTLYNHDKVMAYIEVNENGTWTYSPSKDLDLGQYSLVVMQTDKAGNTSIKSTVFNFTVEAVKATNQGELKSSLIEDSQQDLLHAQSAPQEIHQTAVADVLMALDEFALEDLDGTGHLNFAEDNVDFAELLVSENTQHIDILEGQKIVEDVFDSADIILDQDYSTKPEILFEAQYKIYDELFEGQQLY